MLDHLNLLRKNQSKVNFGLQQTDKQNIKSPAMIADEATTICFLNDVHTKIDHLPQISNRIDTFKKLNEKNSDCFVLGGGDIKSGSDPNLNNLMLLWLESNVHLSALGNHDMDIGTSEFSNELSNFTTMSNKILGKNPDFKYVASNLNISDKEFLDKNLYNKTAVFTDKEKENCHDKKIVSSCILERNGHKYGFIGTVPNNLELILNASKPFLPLSSHLHVSNNHQYNISPEISAFNNDKTILALQKEIDSLKNQGINRIILLSHSGYLNDLAIAQRLDGVDIIIGGHTHNVKPAYYVKSKVGEPVLIVQAGKNGEYIGFLKTVFNKDGVINPLLTETKLEKNNLLEQNSKLNYLWDKILGPKQVLGNLSTAFNISSFDRKTQENPLVSFITNSIKYLDYNLSVPNHQKPADVVLLLNNSEYSSWNHTSGQITDRELLGLSKYNSNLYKFEISGSDLKELLEWGAMSIIDSKDFLMNNSPYPGLINTFGVSYEVDLSNKKRVSNILIRDNQGKYLAPLDMNKLYSVIIDDNFIKTARSYIDQKPYNIVSRTFHKPLMWPEPLSNSMNKQISVYDSLYNYIRQFSGRPIDISRDPLKSTHEPPRLILKNLLNRESCGSVDLKRYNL